MLYCSGIQHRPQLPLRNKKDLICKGILYLGPGREPTHINQALIRRVWAFHKAGFPRDKGSVRVIAFCGFRRRTPTRRRRRSRGLRACFPILRRRRVWIEGLLGRRTFSTARLGRIPCSDMSRTRGWPFITATS